MSINKENGDKETLKKLSGRLLAGIKVLFWLQVLEMIIVVLVICWHEIFPDKFILDFITDKTMIDICTSLGTGMFVLGILSKSGRLCSSVYKGAAPVNRSNARILKSISVTVFAAALVLPALQRTFAKVISPESLSIDISPISVILILISVLLYYLSTVFRCISGELE